MKQHIVSLDTLILFKAVLLQSKMSDNQVNLNLTLQEIDEQMRSVKWGYRK
jgi:hypothetical protein